MPELIKNKDGREKQDCKINSAKRLLPKIRELSHLDRFYLPSIHHL